MKKWVIWAIIFYIHSLFMLYRGIDVIDSYHYNETFPNLNRHAYVGGDAYNYIINANMQTGFFILSASTFIAGTLLIVAGSIIKAIKENGAKDEKISA